MIFLAFLLVTLLTMSSSTIIDCGYDNFYFIVTEGFYKPQQLFCALVDDQEKKFTIDNKYLNRSSLVTLFYQSNSTSAPILTPELYQILPNIKFCIFYNMSSIQVKSDWFNNSENLEELTIFGNKIPILEGRLFVHLSNLLSLKLKNNSIHTIHDDAFVGLNKLKALALGQNKIEFVSPYLLRSLKKLEQLFLNNNPIRTVDNTLLHNFPNLEVILLDETFLQSLPDGFFDKNLKLTHVYIQYTNISRMSNKIFSHHKNLEYIDFRDNACVSQEILHHSSSVAFTEDILLPCSCKLKVEQESSWSWKMCIIGLAVIAIVGLFLILLVCKRIRQWLIERCCLKKGSALKKVVKKTMKEYVNTTSIHGLNYIANETSFLIRFFWIFSILVSTVAFSYYSFNTYVRWRDFPIILGFDEQLMDIFEIPFPAVTVCPNFKFDKRQVNLTTLSKFYEYKIINRDEVKHLEAANILCDKKATLKMKHKPFNKNLDIDQYKTKELFFITMHWRENTDFSYRPLILTEEGICDAYNAINAHLIFRNDTVDPDFLKKYQHRPDNTNPEFWSMEEGYNTGRAKSYPRRSFDIGRDNGLMIDLKLKEKLIQYIDTICRMNAMSFRIFLHHPAEVISKNYYEISMNKSVSIIIKPKIIKTADSLKSYDPSVRQCYFPGERQLKFFQIYTKANCEMECLTNLTLRYCNCTTFFMPRSKGTEICKYNQHKICLNYAKRILSNKFQVDLICDSSSIDEQLNCNCLPPCYEITYSSEIIQNDISLLESDLYNTLHNSEIRIYFDEKQITTMQRSELFGFIDFISNCGGLMGLFMGISILSVIEIVYYLGYFVCQLFCQFRRQNIRVRDASDAEEKDQSTDKS